MRLLIVDDERRVRESIKLILMGEDFETLEAENLDIAHHLLRTADVDVILLDVHFGNNRTCFSLLEKLKSEGSTVSIIILSGAASTSEAAQAIKLGAYDFLEKPVNADRLLVSLKNALQAAYLRDFASSATSHHHTEIIGASPAIQKMREVISLFARKDAKVLITGESGTGKELVAEAVWQASARANAPFVVVNSAAIPENLIESELFGHRKGAFTGAIAKQIGKIEMADKGTLFLDEIGELSLAAQSKLLRFLETGEIQAIGEASLKKCDVRLIAATSRDLEAEIKAGRFREDLYYRLNVARIIIPPLRERREDVSRLFAHFVQRICEKYKESPKTFSSGLIELLEDYSWPGNIRELRNIAERAVLLSDTQISVDLIRDILGHFTKAKVSPSLRKEDILPLREYRKRMEWDYISRTIEFFEGSVAKAANALEMDRSHLHQKIKEMRND